jgi:hypothetical protein
VHLSPRLKRGQCRDLEPEEVQALLKLLPPERKAPREPGPDIGNDLEADVGDDDDRIDLAEK